MRVEHIQDGIERIEFAAGMAAVEYVHRLEGLISQSSETLSVQYENLPATVSRFFSEWKSQKKEIERLRERLADLEKKNLSPEMVGAIPLLVKKIDLSGKELAVIGGEISSRGGVALLASGTERITVTLMSGTSKVNACEIIGQVCSILGGKGGGSATMAQGGGPDVQQLDLAMKIGKDRIMEALRGH